ncbi:MAG: hypothetical protein M0R70_03605 [Nitrospirae bacterium]|nr:hypothetical protein [Nitrospirota bacterium]
MSTKPDNEPVDDEGWEYGDVWKQGSPDQPTNGDDVEYVEILRTDVGAGYDDSYMLELVTYLGSYGIEATYDSFSLGVEGGAIKTYVLKAESGKEEEAVRLINEKFKAQP